MSHLDNVKLYVQTWIKTAAADKITVEWAWFVRRMCLTCNVCKQTLTSPIPDSEFNVDYSVQEFVKIHAHKGSHHSGCSCFSCSGMTTKLPPVGVTADFKTVKAVFDELPSKQSIPWNVPDTPNDSVVAGSFGELTNLPKAAKTPLNATIPLSGSVYNMPGPTPAPTPAPVEKKTPVKKDVRGRKFR